MKFTNARPKEISNLIQPRDIIHRRDSFSLGVLSSRVLNPEHAKRSKMDRTLSEIDCLVTRFVPWEKKVRKIAETNHPVLEKRGEPERVQEAEI